LVPINVKGKFQGTMPAHTPIGNQRAGVGQGDAAVLGRGLGPNAEGLARRLDGLVDVLTGAKRDRIDRLARGRITDWVRPARARADAFATYQHHCGF